MTRATQQQARRADKSTVSAHDPVRVRQLVDAGQWLCEHWCLRLRRREVRQLVMRWLDQGRDDIGFRAYFLTYADPTGELACEHVMRELREQ